MTTTIKTVSIDKMATTIQREVFEMTGALMDHHMQEQFCGISGDPIILGSSVARYDQAEYDAAVREMSKVLNVSEDLTHTSWIKRLVELTRLVVCASMRCSSASHLLNQAESLSQ